MPGNEASAVDLILSSCSSWLQISASVTGAYLEGKNLLEPNTLNGG